MIDGWVDAGRVEWRVMGRVKERDCVGGENLKLNRVMLI